MHGEACLLPLPDILLAGPPLPVHGVAPCRIVDTCAACMPITQHSKPCSYAGAITTNLLLPDTVPDILAAHAAQHAAPGQLQAQAGGPMGHSQRQGAPQNTEAERGEDIHRPAADEGGGAGAEEDAGMSASALGVAMGDEAVVGSREELRRLAQLHDSTVAAAAAAGELMSLPREWVYVQRGV